jgi:L-ascorbate metabolism protein UlaG (beta-lactamase superfamily)
MGSVLDFASAASPKLRLYISGDTLLHDELHEIPKRFPNVDLGIFHLGGTRLMGILLTMNAEQGVEAFNIVSPQYAIPVHYDDYPVFKDPLENFVSAAAEAGIADRMVYVERGSHCAFRVAG